MTHVKPRSDSFIARLDRRWDRWAQSHLPTWLYKEVTFQPDRTSKPENYKRAQAFNLLLIAIAVILLILSLK